MSFPPMVPEGALTAEPADLAGLLVGIAERQWRSATATEQTALDAIAGPSAPFAPLDGSFNAAVAAALSRWKEE